MTPKFAEHTGQGPIPICVIGASAGGAGALQSLQRIVGVLRARSGHDFSKARAHDPLRGTNWLSGGVQLRVQDPPGPYGRIGRSILLDGTAALKDMPDGLEAAIRLPWQHPGVEP
ncbi:MAG: hypothetical protein Q8K20_15430 [Gemmobacter sp.]|nr:hypothetical protein [Gemmobacter sp.]